MKIIYRQYNAVASWRWDVKPLTQPEAGSSENPQLQGTIQSDLNSASEDDESDEDNDDEEEEDEEDEVCGICQLEFESACPGCKVPGDDCPLSKSDSSRLARRRCRTKQI
jgi:anaphase-promoting complex subunit 11